MKGSYKTSVTIQEKASPFYTGEIEIEINVSIPEPLAESLRGKMQGFGQEEAKSLFQKIAEIIK